MKKGDIFIRKDKTKNIIDRCVAVTETKVLILESQVGISGYVFDRYGKGKIWDSTSSTYFDENPNYRKITGKLGEILYG